MATAGLRWTTTETTVRSVPRQEEPGRIGAGRTETIRSKPEWPKGVPPTEIADVGNEQSTKDYWAGFSPTGTLSVSDSSLTEPERTAPFRNNQSVSPVRVTTEFEPHLRDATIREIASLLDRFKDALGKPEASTRAEDLKLHLSQAYRTAVKRPESRNLATAISMLQDFVTPHWSTISADTADRLSSLVKPLRTERNLSPAVLERLCRDLIETVGRPGVGLEFEDDEQDVGREDSE